MDINNCVFTGRLGADPELRHTQNNTPVCTFDLAVERMKAKGTEKAETDWLTFVAWRSTAEYISKYLTKGSAVTVQARASVRKWTDRDGNSRKAVEFVVDEIKGSGSRQSYGSAPAPSPPAPAASYTPGQDAFSELDDTDGDLPF
mgnify:CR=1 FL=1